MFRRFMIVCWSLLGATIFAFCVSWAAVEIRDMELVRLGDAAAIQAEIRDPYAVAHELRYWEAISAERVRFLEAKHLELEHGESFEILVRHHSIYSETPTMSLAQARDKHAQTQAWTNELDLIYHRYEWAMFLGFVAYACGIAIFIWNVICHTVNWFYGLLRAPE
jgi:hypothetical protein